MIIRSKVLKLSSLCIIGASVFLVNKLEPDTTNLGAKVKDYVKDTKDSIFDSGSSDNEKNSDNSTINDNNLGEDNSDGIDNNDNDTKESNNNVNSEKNETQNNDSNTRQEINNKIPDIEGLSGNTVDLNNYKDLVIAKIDSYLNIRKGPGTNYGVVGKMPKNAGGYIKDTVKSGDETWYKIESGDVTGYVSGEYLYTGEEALKRVVEVGRYVIHVTCDKLNVRAEPSQSSQVLFQISKGEELEVESVKGDWVEVSVVVGNETSYVSKDHVEISFELKKAFKIDDALATGVSATRTGIVEYAKQFLGNPYKYGGEDLNHGIDCSAFTRAIYKRYGYSLPRTAAEQAKLDKATSADKLRPGDLVYYAKDHKNVSHAAIYIGKVDGVAKIIHASNPRSGINIANMYYTTPYKYLDVIGND